jgi:hypothetical protein
MRFMIIRKADVGTEAGIMPSPELFTAMGDYMQEMGRAGVLLAGDGLKPSREGVRVEFHQGKPTVVDGPFTETKELVAGYAIIDVASLEEALGWVKKWPILDADGEVRLEIRPFFEAEDFGDALPAEARAREDRMRAELARRNS